VSGSIQSSAAGPGRALASGRRDQIEEQKSLFVLTADLVGYSERMFHDAREGIRALVETRRILADAVIGHRGRVISTPGDFLLAVFEHSVPAVAAAVEGQSTLLDRNRGAPAKNVIAWRIGIAFGDVFEIGNDIYGHAVNIAARVQALARPGDILVSDKVEERLRSLVDFPMERLGPHRLKNIAAPVVVYRLRWPGLEESVAGLQDPAVSAELLRRISKPVLRIEPFDLLDRSEREARMARAIENDIHVVLSRLSNSITVIDPAAALVGTQADYLLKGSLQGAGNHLRLTARLVSLSSGATIWAERYDCDLRENFHVQDDIAREIVTGLQLALTEGAQALSWRRGTTLGLAWERFQIGRDHENRYSRHGHREARRCYEEAVRLDPSYLSALVALGFCHVDEVRLGWSEEDTASLANAETAYRRASAVNPDHPDVLALLAFIRQMQGRIGEARSAMDQAVRAADQNSDIIGYQGALLELLGDFPAAMRSYARALTLTPHARPWVYSNLALAHLAVGHADEAERIYRSVIEHYPDYTRAWIGLAIALHRRNRETEARAAAARVVELDPSFTVTNWGRSRPFSDETLLTVFMADMRDAGLPP
jgi:class 3 adenylate cyclase/TolB-like protein